MKFTTTKAITLNDSEIRAALIQYIRARSGAEIPTGAHIVFRGATAEEVGRTLTNPGTAKITFTE